MNNTKQVSNAQRRELMLKAALGMRWITKEGNTLVVSEMSLQHLKNAKSMLERKIKLLELEGLNNLSYNVEGEMASYYAEAAAESSFTKAKNFQRMVDNLSLAIDFRREMDMKHPTAKVIVYSVGICAASACVEAGLTRKQIEKLVNIQEPTGITSKWKISRDKHFHSGQTNPCPCEEHPKKRMHYFLNC